MKKGELAYADMLKASDAVAPSFFVGGRLRFARLL